MRPRLLASLTVVAVALGAGCNSSNNSTMPPPGRGAIKHVVILLQENRSFDNLFAGFPGAHTAMEGECKASPSVPQCEVGHKVHLKAIPLAEGPPSKGGKDICHSHGCFVTECDANSQGVCRNDGFDLITYGEGSGGPLAYLYPYAYVRRSDTKAYWDLAKAYALADEMFFTETASSFIAHQVILSGTVALNSKESLTDEPSAMPWGCDAPRHRSSGGPATTALIFRNGHVSPFGGPFPCFTQYRTLADLLDRKDVSWKYYVAAIKAPHEPSGQVWDGYDGIERVRYGHDWKTHVVNPGTAVLTDIKDGTLPSMSWVIPTLYDSDHPGSGCNGGPRWITSVVDAIGGSPYWNDTAIIVLWDDWGGWFDSFPPPQISYTRLGFRVPMIVISPYVKAHTISHTQYDFGSVLRFAEETFGLGSLGTADATANSMSGVFDFSQAPIAFHAEPKPRANTCSTPPSLEAIIAHNHEVPD
ncbi:MAG: hypothetical protein JO351_04270 [Candidatus Eremiobacteraeota bacterium]|nr:hypothetical protein [Candidatus Eremiobacteraeota bacterium]